MRIYISVIILIISCIFNNGILFADDDSPIAGPEDGRLITGIIVNKNTGQPVEGEVLAMPENNGEIIAVPTGADGKFQLRVPRTNCTIKFNARNFNSVTIHFTSTMQWNQNKIALNPLPVTPEISPQTEIGSIIIPFSFARDNLSSESLTKLNRLAVLLKSHPAIRILIRAHTDAVTNTAHEEINMAICKNRAEAVKQYLISKGIEIERMTVKYYGANAPVAPNDNEENRAKNRRVDFRVVN